MNKEYTHISFKNPCHIYIDVCALMYVNRTHTHISFECPFPHEGPFPHEQVFFWRTVSTHIQFWCAYVRLDSYAYILFFSFECPFPHQHVFFVYYLHDQSYIQVMIPLSGSNHSSVRRRLTPSRKKVLMKCPPL